MSSVATHISVWPARWFFRRVAQPVATGQDRYNVNSPATLAGIALTDDDIQEFQQLYQQLSGTMLDQLAAREKATALMLFVQALIAPGQRSEQS